MKSTPVAPLSVGVCSLTTACVLILLAHRNPVDAWVVPPRYHATVQPTTTGLANGFWDWLNPGAAQKEESSSKASDSNKQDFFGNWFQTGSSTHSKEDDEQHQSTSAEASSSQETKETYVISSSQTDEKIDAAVVDEKNDEVLPQFIVDQLEAYDKDAHGEESKTTAKEDSPSTDNDEMMGILYASSSPFAPPEEKKKERKQEKQEPAVQDATVLHHGHVKWFDPTKGYGFISFDDSKEDIFVHQSAIVSDLGFYRKLITGEPVEFTLQPGKNGRVCAAHVTGPHGKPVHSILQQQLDGPPQSAKH